ncbi:DUF6470 family protein [Robertmurraya andreesenii]|uniref:YviE n=1 Tax=Anoxybacillus andreesenii TaxID=1325932 RepID=A0ABT9V7J6_9BACL|nr:DUF6470 family protein [Robertmurraya andreesenii]MDQ0156920.1 hypothetical protein [Robertmurraya andreesenii]
MQLPRLELHNTYAQLDVQKKNASIEIKQPKAELNYNQPQPSMEIQKSASKLEIDQTEAFADANLKHPFRNIKEWAEKAKQKILQSLAEKANEGDRLMKIEDRSESVIPEIARQKSGTPPKQFNIGFMPSSTDKVKFSYQPSEIKIIMNTEPIKLNAKTHGPTIKYHPGDFNIYLKQKASLKIQAVGATLDQKI